MNEDRLVQEFLGVPQGHVREGSLVVRPSLRAAVERFLIALAGVTAFFIPIAFGTILQSDDPGEAATSIGAVGALNLVFGLGIPILLSFAPAVQLAFTRYVFDDEGIRERVQILSKTEKRVKWEKVTALQHRRTLLDKILGIERIDVIAYGARGATIHVVGLREAARFRDIVSRQMRAQANIRRLLSND